MNLRPLLINEKVKADVDRVVTHARANPISLVRVVRMMNKNEPPIGETSRLNVCMIPVEFQCCYSVEIQPIGKVAHLSVSIPEAGKLPNEQAFYAIAKLFGFTANEAKDFSEIWVEPLPEGRSAINAVQELEMSWKK